MADYRYLLEYCETDRQVDAINAYTATGSASKAAKRLGVSDRAFFSLIKRAKACYARQNKGAHVDGAVPEGFRIKGASTMIKDAAGNIQWLKTSADDAMAKEFARQAAEVFAESLPKVKPPKYSVKNPNKDIIPWFQIGDAHIGMLAHKAEVGHNFDLSIAKRELCTAMAILIEETNPCERCVINDLGDFTHYENISGTTEASGHALDFDGRFPKMVNAYIDIMRFIVEKALERFKFVDVIINQGNHSRTNDIWMRQLLKHVYGGNRVNVLDNASVFIPYRMGNTFVMTHHSDKCKPSKLVDVMASDFADDWGESTYRYIDIGHIHHRMQAKEMAGVTVESWNQLAPMDKYAHDGGWRSRSCLQVVERSKTYGEVSRRTLPVERVKDILDSLKPGDTAKKRREVYTV